MYLNIMNSNDMLLLMYASFSKYTISFFGYTTEHFVDCSRYDIEDTFKANVYIVFKGIWFEIIIQGGNGDGTIKSFWLS